MCAPELFFLTKLTEGGECVRVRVCFFLYSVRLAVCAGTGGDAGKHTHTHVEGICHSAHTLLFRLAVTLEAR